MIKIEDFLNPISGDNECGEYLRFDAIYDQIEESRREDDPRLSQGVWQIELKKADWPEVTRLCSDALQNRTKDLQLAVWLTESLMASEKFDGFRQGIDLLLALSSRFWEKIYPLIADDDNGRRLAPFYYLSEKLTDKILLFPITNPRNDLDAYSLSDWITAQYNLKIHNKGISLKQLGKSIADTSPQFFKNLKNSIELLAKSTHKLDDFLTEKLPKDAPSFKQLYDYLEQISHIIVKAISEETSQNEEQATNEEKTTMEKISTETTTTAEAADESSSPALSSSSVAVIAQNALTVETAYENLRNIGGFFEHAQPQSPATILVQIASIIGRKSFQELLDINTHDGRPIVNTIHELYTCFSEKKPIEPKPQQ